MKSYPVVIVLLTVTILFGCSKNEDILQTADETDIFFLAKKSVEEMLSSIECATKGETERTIESYWIKEINTKIKGSDDKAHCLYVFNFKNNEGFSIVSSDPEKGLLALSFSGTLKEGAPIDNPGLKVVLDNLEAYAEMPARVDSIEYFVYGPWVATTIYPQSRGYCEVKWNQGYSTSQHYYNEYCRDVNGNYCPAGCVAVAVGQLMAIYKYPSTYNGYIFDWDAMVASAAAQNNSGDYYVARLFQQLGLPGNLNMNYSTSGSSSSIFYAPQTLAAFGYTNGGVYDLFDTSSWNELINGYPILMRGQSSTSGGGHAWLAHGILKATREIQGCNINGEPMFYEYESKYFVLCNFGWGGAADGYYAIDAFSPVSGPVFQDPVSHSTTLGGYSFPYDIYSIRNIRL